LRFVMRLKKVRSCEVWNKTAVLLLRRRCCPAALREPAQQPRAGVRAVSLALTAEKQECWSGLNRAAEAARRGLKAAMWVARIYFPL
jgi:hypothetical protein